MGIRPGVDYGLKPAYSLVAFCEGNMNPHIYENYVYTGVYIFKINGQYVLVKSIAEMQTLFAPIQDADEALSYALLATGLVAKYDFETQFVAYLQEVVEDTHVIQNNDGFVVYLYHFTWRGCPRVRILSQIELSIQNNGNITWTGAVPIYAKAPEICE
jgi:hypothetical protein